MKIAFALCIAAAAAVPTLVSAEEWHLFSKSAATGYLAEVTTIRKDGDTTIVTLARVPRRGLAASDLSHEVEEVAFRCEARQMKTLSSTEMNAAGAKGESFPGDAEFEAVPARGLRDDLRQIACDNARVPETFASVQAYIEAGRP